MTSPNKPSQYGSRLKYFQSDSGDQIEVTDEIINSCSSLRQMLFNKTRSDFINSLGAPFVIQEKDGQRSLYHPKEQRTVATVTSDSPEKLVITIHHARPIILTKLLEFATYNVDYHTSKERKAWTATFADEAASVLCELASIAYYLDIKPLVNVTSRAIASQVSGKTAAELKVILSQSSDQTKTQSSTSQQQTTTIKATISTTSPQKRIKVQQLLSKYEKKKQKKQALNSNSTSETQTVTDNRSLDEILEFLGETKSKKSTKSQKSSPNQKSPAKKSQEELITKQDTKIPISPSSPSSTLDLPKSTDSTLNSIVSDSKFSTSLPVSQITSQDSIKTMSELPSQSDILLSSSDLKLLKSTDFPIMTLPEPSEDKFGDYFDEIRQIQTLHLKDLEISDTDESLDFDYLDHSNHISSSSQYPAGEYSHELKVKTKGSGRGLNISGSSSTSNATSYSISSNTTNSTSLSTDSSLSYNSVSIPFPSKSPHLVSVKSDALEGPDLFSPSSISTHSQISSSMLQPDFPPGLHSLDNPNNSDELDEATRKALSIEILAFQESLELSIQEQDMWFKRSH